MAKSVSRAAAGSATATTAADFPAIIRYLLNSSDPSENTVNVSLTGALNNILIEGVNFDPLRVQFVVVAQGLSFYDFEILFRDENTISGSFTACGLAFPGLTANCQVFVYVYNLGVRQVAPATAIYGA